MPKNKPSLDAKAWDRIWKKELKWHHKNYQWPLGSTMHTKAIQRIVNAELRKVADAEK